MGGGTQTIKGLEAGGQRNIGDINSNGVLLIPLMQMDRWEDEKTGLKHLISTTLKPLELEVGRWLEKRHLEESSGGKKA